MGHQINYYLLPDDTRLLEERLREKCALLILDRESPNEVPVQLPNLEVAEFGKTRLGVVLAQPESLASVHLRPVPQQGSWVVETDLSPVIELGRCYYDGKILRRARVYYHRHFLEEGAWVEKPESFQRWAQGIFAIVRKTLQKLPGKSDYVGPQALAEYQQVRVKLVT